MIQLKRIIAFFTISLLLISCSEDFFEKPIDLDLDAQESKLAGTAMLGVSNETNQVLVSFSQDPFDENLNAQVLNNATVALTGSNTAIDFHPIAPNNFYVANSVINFIPNNEYTLTISAPNYETIIAKQTYPEKSPILEATINENSLKIKINDNSNQKDYYLLKLQRKDGNNSYHKAYLYPFGSQTKESGFYDGCVTFNDATFNGEQNFEIITSNSSFSTSTTYKVILYHITEDFYRYDTSLRVSDYAEENPFVEPIILHSNFDKGYGIFSLVNTSTFIIKP